MVSVTSWLEFEHDVKIDIEVGVREGVKVVLAGVLQEEMSEHLDAGYRDLTLTRRGELRADTIPVTW
jgi:hypothetical protein